MGDATKPKTISLRLTEDECYAVHEALCVALVYPRRAQDAELFEQLRPVLEHLQRKMAERGWPS